MTESRKLRVFICHASQDKPIVRELYQRLSAEGWIDPWLDEEKLLPGQDWGMEIEKAVEAADAVIVCLSNNSVNKEGYVQRELKFVLDIALEKPDGTVFIVPLRLDAVQPPRRLRAWQFADYFPKERRNIAHGRLLESLRLRQAGMNVDKASPYRVILSEDIGNSLKDFSNDSQIREWEWLAGYLRHNVGQRVSETEWGVFMSNLQGHLAFGQYIDLEPGAYIAIFYMKWEGSLSPEMDIAIIDACANAGGKIIEKRTVTSSEFSEANAYQEFRLHFRLLNPERNMEFRYGTSVL